MDKRKPSLEAMSLIPGTCGVTWVRARAVEVAQSDQILNIF